MITPFIKCSIYSSFNCLLATSSCARIIQFCDLTKVSCLFKRILQKIEIDLKNITLTAVNY